MIAHFRSNVVPNVEVRAQARFSGREKFWNMRAIWQARADHRAQFAAVPWIRARAAGGALFHFRPLGKF
jgi:hypothetical protein